MTFEQAIEKYLDEHGDFGTAMHFGQAMYEAGKAASRRPRAVSVMMGEGWALVVSGPSQESTRIIRGGFRSQADTKEWARSNGYEV